jgi:hypothetical protein
MDNPQPPRIPRVVVWDDYGVTKANMADYTFTLDPEDEPRTKVLLYQMHAPLCQGVLWKDFRPFNKRGADNRKLPAVLVVIDVDDLRAQGFNISRGISWEKTMEDFKANLEVILDELELPRYMRLIVRCGYEAVFYVGKRSEDIPSQPQVIPFVTYMVPSMAEGHVLETYNGRMTGIDTAFVTGLAASLVKESDVALADLEDSTVGQALEAAIVRSHRFASAGFRQDSTGAIDYPKAQDLTNAASPTPRIIHARSDLYNIQEDGKWSLFSLAETWKEDIAAETVKTGTQLMEACVPTAQYGPLKTADRAEIEGFRSAEAVIKQYLVGNVKKPLSIAVFGQPGSGKSFGVKEVIKAVLNNNKLKLIEANLSQFAEYADLVGILDSVRYMSTGKDIPVVLFDEFDSEFSGKALGWLKYFLAPMQDAQYLHNGEIRSLGRAIFVFIGGTSSTFEDFRGVTRVGAVTQQGEGVINIGQNEMDRAEKKASDEKQAKKPDFISRLSAHINVAGPNPPKGNVEDKMVIIRRAILLRSLLERRLDMKGAIQVDQTLLMALLKQKEFLHGSRSLELILQSSRVSSGQKLQPWALPPYSQLAMHLNLEEYKVDMRKRLKETWFRPVDVTLYNKLRWAAWAQARQAKTDVSS